MGGYLARQQDRGNSSGCIERPGKEAMPVILGIVGTFIGSLLAVEISAK
jgi:uncharacterized membrane protein YeaQ/YmgE (transglycosylase-associated protein family)